MEKVIKQILKEELTRADKAEIKKRRVGEIVAIDENESIRTRR